MHQNGFVVRLFIDNFTIVEYCISCVAIITDNGSAMENTNKQTELNSNDGMMITTLCTCAMLLLCAVVAVTIYCMSRR